MSIIDDLEYRIDYMLRNPGDAMYGPDDIRSLISKAESRGIDMTSYRNRLPELDAAYIRGRIEKYIRYQRQEPGDVCFNPTDIRKFIEKAKGMNVDVSQYEVQLSELDLIYAKGRVVSHIEFFRKYPRDTVLFFDDFLEDIKKAKEIGADLSAYSADICRFKKLIIERKIQKWRR